MREIVIAGPQTGIGFAVASALAEREEGHPAPRVGANQLGVSPGPRTSPVRSPTATAASTSTERSARFRAGIHVEARPSPGEREVEARPDPSGREKAGEFRSGQPETGRAQFQSWQAGPRSSQARGGA